MTNQNKSEGQTRQFRPENKAWPAFESHADESNSAVMAAEQEVTSVLRRWASQAGLLGFRPEEFLDRDAPNHGQRARLLNSAFREEGSFLRHAPPDESHLGNFALSYAFGNEENVLVDLMSAPYADETQQNPTLEQ